MVFVEASIIPPADAITQRVLIVEDNLDSARSLTLLLRNMGHHAEYAINGYAGLALARSLLPHLILLDIGLPGMDGFEFCRRVKADAALKAARVIVMTGYGSDEYRERSKAAGCDLHLLKPVSSLVLKSLLEPPR
jgi:CheY-like chemotaxis protein